MKTSTSIWGYRERVLEPTDDKPDVGEVPFMHWQEKYNEDSVAFLDLAVEQYSYGLKTRPTFNTGIDLVNNDNGTITASGFLKNYYANGEAIRQDIYWGGVQFDACSAPCGYGRSAAFTAWRRSPTTTRSTGSTSTRPIRSSKGANSWRPHRLHVLLVRPPDDFRPARESHGWRPVSLTGRRRATPSSRPAWSGSSG